LAYKRVPVPKVKVCLEGRSFLELAITFLLGYGAQD
jgi:hypothetical protein